MAYVFLHSGQLSAKRLANRLPNCTEATDLASSASGDVVIRWGSQQSSDRDKVLNSRRALQNVANRKQMLLMLQNAGIRTPLAAGATGTGNYRETRLRLTRHYRVPVMNMNVMSLFRSDGNTVWLDRRIGKIPNSFREVSMTEDFYAVRMTKLALRALHAVGLDFGLVSLGISAKGFGYVLDIDPAPELSPRLLELFTIGLADWMEQDDYEGTETVTYGTDLEFMLRSKQGNMVLASKYLPRKGEVGCDDRSINRDKKRLPLAEIRPIPAETGLQLFENLTYTMHTAAGLIDQPNVEWLAGSMPFPGYSVGGHIHFKGIPLSSQLVRALDHYLGFPVMMIEKGETAKKRRPKYGFLGDIRKKDHGGFEYRVPGSWLVSPEIARAVLCLAETVVNHYEVLGRDFFVEREIQQAFYEADKWRLRGLFYDVWGDLAETSTYKEYTDYLSIIPRMVSQGLSWDEQVDLRSTWKLPIPRPSTKRLMAR